MFFQNLTIPAICTPITGRTEIEIFQQLKEILTQKPDLIEWRADFFEDLANQEKVLAIINKLKAKTNIPLLFTIRAMMEGGETITLSETEKVKLIKKICQKTHVDVIDYEAANEENFVKTLCQAAKENGKEIILSYHNFKMTPTNDELIAKAKKAATLGADVVKLAVMPETKKDVLRLLDVTKEIDDILTTPVITMSMSEIGALSRIIGWAYGSVLTFAIGVESSAPGQIPVQALRDLIEKTKQFVPWD